MDILDAIIANKRKELKIQKESLSLVEMVKATEKYMMSEPHKVISMSSSLLNSNSGIISEFKRKSPSKGWIKETGRVDSIPLSYSQNGASAISILTDKEYFGGDVSYIATARRSVISTPILRKEFIIDEYQIYESRLIGADAILLIAADLDINTCKRLSSLAHEIGLEVLLEIHEEMELDYIGDNIDMVGVNNRNLGSFKTDVENSFNLAPLLPTDYVLVSESGISSVSTVKDLRSVGFRGFLIGETFMRSQDPGYALKQFITDIES